jgi:hypothetical protein
VPKLFFYDGDSPRERVYIQSQPRRRYGFFRFAFDCFMFIITGGLWIIWVFVREMRR